MKTRYLLVALAAAALSVAALNVLGQAKSIDKKAVRNQCPAGWIMQMDEAKTAFVCRMPIPADFKCPDRWTKRIECCEIHCVRPPK
jgi:hypothetical protein